MDGRIFGLDAQLLFDACLQAINIFILFTFVSYLLFNPAREILRKRRERINSENETAKSNKEEAIKLKEEYTQKLNNVNKEAETILSASRKKALQNEELIIAEAKLEANRILERANNEIELEKKKARDEVKKEMIAIASLMAGKFITASIDQKTQAGLIDDALKEMGDSTWLS